MTDVAIPSDLVVKINKAARLCLSSSKDSWCLVIAA